MTVDDLMQHPVMTVTPLETLGNVRRMMREHAVSAMPVVDTDGNAVGMVTATDFLDDFEDDTPVDTIMATPVHTVPRYGEPGVAAQLMRNHHVHHVVVTEGPAVVGMLTSFDLLELVENHRYTTAPRVQRPEESGHARGGRWTIDPGW